MRYRPSRSGFAYATLPVGNREYLHESRKWSGGKYREYRLHVQHGILYAYRMYREYHVAHAAGQYETMLIVIILVAVMLNLFRVFRLWVFYGVARR